MCWISRSSNSMPDDRPEYTAMISLPSEIAVVVRNSELLFSQAEVDAAFDRLAKEVSQSLGESNPIVIAVMKGGLYPTAQLTQRFEFCHQLDYVHATPYRGNLKGKALNWLARPRLSLKHRVVLVIDDIFDDGVTLAGVAEECRHLGAQRVASVVLVRKGHGLNRTGFEVDFCGLEVDDRCMFGCGMDYKEYLRHVPEIYAVNE